MLEDSEKKVKRLTSTQQNKIGALFFLHLRNFPELGHSLYDEGWSDEMIAQEVGCFAPEVKYRRKQDESYLPLKRESKTEHKTDPQLWGVVSALVAKHNALVEFTVAKLSHSQTERGQMLFRLKVAEEKKDLLNGQS